MKQNGIHSEKVTLLRKGQPEEKCLSLKSQCIGFFLLSWFFVFGGFCVCVCVSLWLGIGLSVMSLFIEANRVGYQVSRNAPEQS